MSNIFELVHGETKVSLLFCNRAAMLFLSEAEGLSGDKENVRSMLQSADAIASGLYYSHLAYTEDERKPLTLKKSQFIDLILDMNGAENNIPEAIKGFTDSIQDFSNAQTEAKKKKQSVQATIN